MSVRLLADSDTSSLMSSSYVLTTTSSTSHTRSRYVLEQTEPARYVPPAVTRAASLVAASHQSAEPPRTQRRQSQTQPEPPQQQQQQQRARQPLGTQAAHKHKHQRQHKHGALNPGAHKPPASSPLEPDHSPPASRNEAAQRLPSARRLGAAKTMHLPANNMSTSPQADAKSGNRHAGSSAAGTRPKRNHHKQQQQQRQNHHCDQLQQQQQQAEPEAPLWPATPEFTGSRARQPVGGLVNFADQGGPGQWQREQRQTNHYEENILLFATEHDADARCATPPSQAGSPSPDYGHYNSNSNNNNHNDPHQNSADGAARRAHLHASSYGEPPLQSQQQQQQQQRASRARAQRCVCYAAPMGLEPRRSDYYSPAWRRAQSPSTPSQYAFHVPAHSPVAPLRPLRSAIRSRTLGHIPSSAAGEPMRAPALGSQHLSQHPNSSSNPNQDELGDEHLYERMLSARCSAGPAQTRQFMQSEGDLLRARLVEVGGPGGREREQERDNPFKPGTELSREADLMVRLMKRGYPVRELPELVRAAKRMQADELQRKSRSQPHLCESAATKPPASGSRPVSASHKPAAPLMSDGAKRAPPPSTESVSRGGRKEAAAKSATLPASQSAFQIGSGLRGGGGAAASSEASSVASAGRDDSDSIDRLIASIEAEAQALQAEEGEQRWRQADDKRPTSKTEKRARRPGAGPNKPGAGRLLAAGLVAGPAGRAAAKAMRGKQAARNQQAADLTGRPDTDGRVGRSRRGECCCIQ